MVRFLARSITSHIHLVKKSVFPGYTAREWGTVSPSPSSSKVKHVWRITSIFSTHFLGAEARHGTTFMALAPYTDSKQMRRLPSCVPYCPNGGQKVNFSCIQWGYSLKVSLTARRLRLETRALLPSSRHRKLGLLAEPITLQPKTYLE